MTPSPDPSSLPTWQKVLLSLAQGAGQGLQTGLTVGNPAAAAALEQQRQQQFQTQQAQTLTASQRAQLLRQDQQSQAAAQQQDFANQLNLAQLKSEGYLVDAQPNEDGAIKYESPVSGVPDRWVKAVPFTPLGKPDMVTVPNDMLTSMGLQPNADGTPVRAPIDKLQPMLDARAKAADLSKRLAAHASTIGQFVDANVSDPRWNSFFKQRSGQLQSDSDVNGLYSEINTYLTNQTKRADDANVEHILTHPDLYAADVVANAQKLFNQIHPSKATGDEAPDIPARTPGLATDQRDEQLLSGLKPAVQNIIKGLADYRLQLPNGFAKAKAPWPEYMALAQQYDPSFDESQYQTRQKLQNDFTSGKSAASINAFNTVIQHVDRLGQHLSALNNTGIPVVNSLVNSVEKQFNPDLAARLQSVQTDAQATASEAERAWRGVGGSEKEIEEWKKRFSTSDSPKAQQGAVNELLGLLKGKLSSLKEQYETGMGRKANFHLMSPETTGVLKQHGVNVDDLAPAAAYGGGQVPTTPAQPQQTQFGPFNPNQARAKYNY